MILENKQTRHGKAFIHTIKNILATFSVSIIRYSKYDIMPQIEKTHILHKTYNIEFIDMCMQFKLTLRFVE